MTQERLDGHVTLAHLDMVGRAFLWTGALLLLWWFAIRDSSFVFSREDASITCSSIEAVAGFFAILAAFVLNKVWTEWQKIEEAVAAHDMAKFALYRDKRIPLTLHLLLFAHAVLMVGLVMLYPYASNFTGGVVVGAFSLLAIIYFLVATDLDDTSRGPWYQKVPRTWLTDDPESELEEKEEP